MNTLESQNILLIGLPGSGKSRVAERLNNQFACSKLTDADLILENHQIEFTRPGCFEWQDFIKTPNNHSSYAVWCVVDIRSILPGDDSSWLHTQLQRLLKISDGIVFTFSEESSLDDQAWWGKWVAQNRPENSSLPVVRMLNHTLPVSFNGFTKTNDTQASSLEARESVKNVSEKIECFHFKLERVVLDHLLMVLDNARQNLGMNITRVVGTLKTLEYQNLVAIEGTPYRWDTFAAESDDQLGQLTISGVNLEKAWLSEMIQACKA